ncbi:MAG TPA: hypothetical protein VLV49_03265 [Terriglobales bacterium]|nr:hypothetical protein [Terriglobales bacterium]
MLRRQSNGGDCSHPSGGEGDRMQAGQFAIELNERHAAMRPKRRLDGVNAARGAGDAGKQAHQGETHYQQQREAAYAAKSHLYSLARGTGIVKN